MADLPTLQEVQRPNISAPAPGTIDFLRIQAYRGQLLEWAAGTMAEVADYISKFNSVIQSFEVPEPTLASEDTREVAALADLADLSETIKDQADPVISGMLDALGDSIANTPPNIDITSIVNLVATALEKEIDESNSLSAFALREVVRSYVASILLDSAFAVLSTDTTEITNTVNAYITRAKSEADTQFSSFDRATLNTHASRGSLDSEIAAEAISRDNARKVRAYTEIENKAEELRQTLMNDAYERAFKRAETRIQAMSLLPLQLPQGAYSIIGDLIRRQYLDPNAFLASLPNVLGLATEGFGNIAQLLQRGRFQYYEGQIAEVGTYTQLLNVIANNVTQVANSIGKMATMEAS